MKIQILSIIISLILFSCNSEIGKSFKIINDLRSEFKINSVEINWTKDYMKFTIQDIDYQKLTIDSLKLYSFKIDDYLTTKYPKIDSVQVRKYLFSGGGGFEIVEFTLDQNNKLMNTKEY